MTSFNPEDQPGITLAIGTEVGDDVSDLIGEGLDEYNITAGGPYDREALWIVTRDADGAVQGGLKAGFDYSWLFIDWLWVAPAWRRRGLATRMLQQAEDRARRRGSIGVFVQTATFQAPAFYRRRGYVEFGRLDDYLPGHAMIWLRKSFADAEPPPDRES